MSESETEFKVEVKQEQEDDDESIELKVEQCNSEPAKYKPNLREEVCQEPSDNNDLSKMTREDKAKRRRETKTKWDKAWRAKWPEEKQNLVKEKNMWRMRLRRGKHPSLTEEKLKELQEKLGIDVSKYQTARRKREQLNKDPKKSKGKSKESKEKSEESKVKSEDSKEKSEESKRRSNFRKLEKRLQMTEEEKEERRTKKYFYTQAYYAKYGRYSDKPREFKDMKNNKLKQWKNSLDPERRKRHYESVKRAQKKTLEKIKREQPEKWKELQKKARETMRQRYYNESEEERKKRRHREKVNGVKRKLRKQLEAEGVNKEEIEKRVKAVHEQMWKEFDPEWSWEQYGKGKGRPRKAYANETHLETCENQDMPPDYHDNSSTIDNLVVTSQENDQSSVLSRSNSEEHVPDNYMNNSFPASPISPAVEESFDETTSTEIQNEFRPFPCSHCTFEFCEESDLRDHLRSSHADKILWTCPKCKEVVLSPQELKTHFQKFHKPVASSLHDKSISKCASVTKRFNFFCMRCPVTHNSPVGFVTRLELFSHVKIKHKWRCFWPCDRCNILKYSKEELELHKRIH